MSKQMLLAYVVSEFGSTNAFSFKEKSIFLSLAEESELVSSYELSSILPSRLRVMLPQKSKSNHYNDYDKSQ